MIDSGFDYFAGGALLSPTGEDGKQKDLYKLSEEAGYKVVKTQKRSGSSEGRRWKSDRGRRTSGGQ